MARLMDAVGSHFDWVIVDSPPAAGLADASIILETVDAAVIVVRAGVTRFPELQAAADALGPERVLGVILNAVGSGRDSACRLLRQLLRRRPQIITPSRQTIG